jgi:predicted permease
MMSIDPQVHRYSAEQTVQFLSQVQEQVAAIPGVLSATWTDQFPLSGSHRSDGFSVPGRKMKYDESANVELYMATEGYFETLGLNRLSGRDFRRENPEGQRVAIVNQSFVEKFFPQENPLGQIVSGGGVNYQIVGVVQNSKARSLDESPRPVLYRALNQTVGSDPSGLGYALVVQVAGNREEISKAIRHDINSRDPNMAIYNMETIEEHLRSALFLPRFAATLFGAFGMVGLTLAAVGLYGVMNYTVSRRTREIGIRMAMGAQSRAVQRLVVRQGMILTLIALVIGFPIALAAAKFANSFLYGVHPHDLVTFTAVPVFLAVVAFLACWLPSRRAAKVNPQTVLRYE